MENPLYEQIYNHLFQKIKSGALAKGDRVPSEKELADQFKVSRITSKKALELLAANRLVERIQGKGTFVSVRLPDLQDTAISRTSESGIGPKAGPVNNTKVIGLILPDFADSYGLKLIHGVEERASELNCHMLMKLTYDNRDVEETAIRSFMNFGVDGFIIFAVHGEHYNSELLRLVLDKYPLVFIDRYLKGIAACSVFTDNRQSAFELTKTLLEKGNTQIGFISPPAENTSTIEDRILGYTDALLQFGLGLKPQHMMTNLYSSLPRSFDERNIQVDIETVKKFVEMNPGLTAYVATEYNLALVLREVLVSIGKRIPEDCQIVCFDSPDNPFGKHLFTHVRQNEFAMGRKAVDLLTAQWQGEEHQLNNIIPHKVIKGSSTL